jgi:hypothetical protein
VNETPNFSRAIKNIKTRSTPIKHNLFPENGGNQGSAIGSVFDRFMKS